MLTKATYEFLKNKPYKKVTVAYKSHRIKVEVADTFMKKMIGLMYRDSLGKDEGMLFTITDPGVISATITMMNMKFSIDIVWLDSKKRVIDIAENAKPSNSIFDSYKPTSNAKYVLELKAGEVKRFGIKKKDLMKFG